MGIIKVELILPNKGNELDELETPSQFLSHCFKYKKKIIFLDSTAHYQSINYNSTDEQNTVLQNLFNLQSFLLLMNTFKISFLV